MLKNQTAMIMVAIVVLKINFRFIFKNNQNAIACVRKIIQNLRILKTPKINNNIIKIMNLI